MLFVRQTENGANFNPTEPDLGALKACGVTLKNHANLADVSSLAFEITTLSRRLSELAKAGPNEIAIDAGYVRSIIASRKSRSKYLASELLGEPVWDMLLDLTLAFLERRLVSVTSLCIAAGVPTSTALRHIKVLMARGLVESVPDPDDARRRYVRLLPSTLDAMLSALVEGRRAFAAR